MSAESKNRPGVAFTKKGDTVYLSGQIDEFADFSRLLSESPPLKLNFKDVKRLNSVGVRNMLTFIRDWGDKPIVYAHCPDIVMDQLSMVKDLMGFNRRVAEVESFYAPYVCDHCDHEEDFLIEVAELKSNSLKLKVKTCPNCGENMDPELAPEFFQFLA